MADEHPGYEFVVATSAEAGKIAAKQIGPGPNDVEPYGRVMYWRLAPARGPDHETMRAGLQKAARRPKTLITYGKVKEGVDLSKDNYKRSANGDSATDTLEDAESRAWLPIDVENVQAAELGRGEFLLEAAEYVRDKLLPKPFAGKTSVITPSSRTGLVGDDEVRLHMHFLLSKAYPPEELRGWAQGARAAGYKAIDPCVLFPSQPIYTARPIFRGGMTDPVPEHLHAVILPGMFGDYVDLDVHQFDAALEDAKASFAGSSGGGGVASDWREYLMNEVGGPEGFRVPLQGGLGRALHSGDSEADIIAFARALVIERTARDHSRRAQYTETWLRAALRSFRAGDQKTANEIIRTMSQLFEEGAY